MPEVKYSIPKLIVDLKEEKTLETLTESYKKMTEPSKASKMLSKVSDKVPVAVKDSAEALKEKITDNEYFLKSMEMLGKSFQTLEKYAAKITLSEKEILKQINTIDSSTQISSLEEICLLRSYEISKIVNKYKYIDIASALVEGAATGAPGFAGIPFNLVLSTFLFYRAVQSVALFYGYDIKNDPAELSIASEVFMSAMSPKSESSGEMSNAIAKIMLLSTTTSIKQTVKKGWQAMAEKGGVHLAIAQIRALANNAAKKAIEKAGKKGIEKTAFTEVFEQIGKKLTQKAVGKAMPGVGAVIGGAIDTAQMIQIIEFANTFYQKRFILEKETRIDILLNGDTYENSEVNIIEIDSSEIQEVNK